jgi:hypothetical protein
LTVLKRENILHSNLKKMLKKLIQQGRRRSKRRRRTLCGVR